MSALPGVHAGERQLVIVAQSLRAPNEAVRKVLLLLIAGPVVLAAAGAAAWLLLRNALVPIDRMRKKAERIGINHLHERLTGPHRRDHIGQLAITHCYRLEEGFAARHRLIADEGRLELFAAAGRARAADPPGRRSDAREHVFDRFYRADSARAGNEGGALGAPDRRH